MAGLHGCPSCGYRFEDDESLTAHIDGGCPEVGGVPEGSRFYYADVDELGIFCVDRLNDDIREWTPEDVEDLAYSHPETIYFYVEPRPDDA